MPDAVFQSLPLPITSEPKKLTDFIFSNLYEKNTLLRVRWQPINITM
jgi:hypothetical protein